jgi:Flp pilus assembly protein protease CpaA
MLFASLGGTFSCQADVALALDRFVSMQLYSALVGGALVAVGMALFRRSSAARAKARAAVPNLPS